MVNKEVHIEKVVQGIRNRDKQALAFLFDHYSHALNGAIVSIVKNKEISEEVLQDVFLKIWEKIEQYDSSKGRFFTWMLNIARNAALDKLRSSEIKRSIKSEDITNYVSKEDQSWHSYQTIDGIGLKEVLEKVPENEKLVLEYIYFNGYTQSEASKELNIPLGTVKTRLRNGLKQIRNVLNIN